MVHHLSLIASEQGIYLDKEAGIIATPADLAPAGASTYIYLLPDACGERKRVRAQPPVDQGDEEEGGKRRKVSEITIVECSLLDGGLRMPFLLGLEYHFRDTICYLSRRPRGFPCSFSA